MKPLGRHPTRAEKFWQEHGCIVVRYDASSGDFTYSDQVPRSLFATDRSCASWHGRCAGKRAGYYREGYCHLSFSGVDIRAHRFAWFLINGEWPAVIDHINGNPADNRIANLRSAPGSTNQMNTKLRSDNKSGAPGVYFHRQISRWSAQMTVRGKRYTVGTFKTREEAIDARLKAQRAAGFSPYHGRPVAAGGGE